MPSYCRVRRVRLRLALANYALAGLMRDSKGGGEWGAGGRRPFRPDR